MSRDLQLAIDSLYKELRKEYGADFSVVIAGNGRIVTESSSRGVINVPEEPLREWAVQYCTEHSNEVEEFGFRGRESEAVDACREQFPGCAIVGTYVKEF